MLKPLLITGLAIAALVFGGSAEAHRRRHADKVKFVCDENGCAVKVTAHGHRHKHLRQRTKIRFEGDVCRYRPWNNRTVCHY